MLTLLVGRSVRQLSDPTKEATMRRILLVLVLLILPVIRSAATDWPMFHLNPRHVGFNRTETIITRQNVKFLRQKWVGIAGDIVDFSSPAVVNGVVYLGSTDGKLYVFNASGCGSSTCTANWTGSAGGSIYSSPTVANGVVYVGSNNHQLLTFPAAGCGQSSCAPTWAGLLGGSILESSPVVSGIGICWKLR